jgi:conjugal transfer pilus assembly protein TraU
MSIQSLLNLLSTMIQRLVSLIAPALASAMMALACNAHAATGGTCFGKFPDVIKDVCWSCMLPITIGGANMTPGKPQDDRPNPGAPVCTCPTVAPPFVKVGLEIGFWEPARMVDIVRKPYCFPGLKGSNIPMSFLTPEGAQDGRTTIGQADNLSFYHAHVYVHPILYEIGAMSGVDCLENGALDVAYVTEMDPTWHNAELSLLLTPEVALFASLPAALTCAADCIAATLGMPLDPMFWCVGCNGLMFPVTGYVQAHVGAVESSALILTRMMFKLHRSLIAKQYWGKAALCGPVAAPMITKSAYKKSLVIPLNQISIAGQCCSPTGRTSMLWGAGMEFPVKGEDFTYILFRKRNCCGSYQQK